MSGSVRIVTSGQTLTVNITRPDGSAAVAYTDGTLSTSLAFPQTISSDTSYYFSAPCGLIVSTKLNGTEIAGGLNATVPVFIEDGQQRVLDPADKTPDVFGSSTFVPLADAGRPYRDSLFRGLSVVTSRPNGFTLNSGNLSDGVNTSANYRYLHQTLVTATGLRLVYGNYYNGSTLGVNDITVKASVEWPEVTAIGNNGQVGAKIPVTFGGQRSVLVQPGCFVVSDPLPIKVTFGNLLYTRTYVSVASAGQKWPVDLYTKGPNWEGATKGAPAADLSDSSGIAQTTEPGYGPIAILGKSVSPGKHPDNCALVGDSILYGSGDTDPNGGGFAQRALLSAGVPYISVAKPGEKSGDILTGTSIYPSPRMSVIAGCTAFIEEYARNDWANGISLVTLQANKVAIWQELVWRGMRGYTVTSIPGTTSTDSWATLGNQTVLPQESVRVALNAWLRDGAPMSNGTAVPVGTVGASRCAVYSVTGALVTSASGAAHLLQGVFEIADTVESARNSGLWKAPGYTADGTHPTATGHAAMAAAVPSSLFVAGS